MTLRLHNFFRNSAGHRVRIALHLKGLDFDYVSVDIRAGRQREESYLKLNPLGLVPVLEHDGKAITQSGAIVEYINELWPTPPLLPEDAASRARARAFAQTIAGEIHPLNNIRIHKFMAETLAMSQERRDRWYFQWNKRGLEALEATLAAQPAKPFAFADYPTVADIFLVPQYYNLRRAKFDLAPYPRLGDIVARCEVLPAFRKAAPEAQPDYVEGQ